MARTIMGRYELEVPLGSGAMGQVWRGRDLTTRRSIAIKLVELASVDDQVLVAETISRFRREAETLARLRHPNIVAAMEAGRVGNELFLVMQLVEGMSLADRLRMRRDHGAGLYPVKSVLGIARQACSGLAAAHANGVVHRDIKPGNLMVSGRDHLTIVDFGIARLLEENSQRLTAPGETIGTLLYMSPEQAFGIDTDGRSDLYSLGCVLYEMLTGRPPFEAEIPIDLLYKHREERPVPLRAVRSDLPDGLSELVGRLLEKERDARPRNAGEVAGYLAAISGDFRDRSVPGPEIDRETPEMDKETELEAKDTGREGKDTETVPPPVAPPSPPPIPPPVLPPPGPPGKDGKRGKGRGKRRRRGPAWPTPSPWPRVLSSLLTFAIVLGVGAYVWYRDHHHQTFDVTNVAVQVPHPEKIACNSTVDVVGVISTDGNGGPVTYQWTENGKPLPKDTATAGSGPQQVRVSLKWPLGGKGTVHATAILKVFMPNVVSAQSASLTYKCAP